MDEKFSLSLSAQNDKMKHLIVIICLLFGFGFCSDAQEDVSPFSPVSPFSVGFSPKYETRAVCLTTLYGLDWPKTKALDRSSMLRQKEELCRTLDLLKAAGINTVMLQTRVRATTIYPSDIEPWDECLTGRWGMNPGYDPLLFAIGECHKRGMELHAWVVALPIGKWGSYGCRRLRKLHPKMVRKIKDEGYLNPENSATANYLAELCAEITRRYDIDGLHLDYLRYPETLSLSGCENVARERITTIASTVSKRVKDLKPWVKISCSPIGKHDDLPRHSSNGWNARRRVGQDAQRWLNNGTMDQLYPMIYFRGDNFYPFALDWQQSAPAGSSVAAGLAVYMMHRGEQNWPLAEIVRQMSFCRGIGMGQCFFRSKFFTDNTKGIYDFAKSDFYSTPALIPPIGNPQGNRPNAPRNLRSYASGDTLLLVWDAAEPQNYWGAEPDYTLYASCEQPVDIADARNIVATKLSQCSVAIANPPHGQHYAVTATDRFGTESTPCQQTIPSNGGSKTNNLTTNNSTTNNLTTLTPTTQQPLLLCKGDSIVLPQCASTAEIALLQIASMAGNNVATILFDGNPVVKKRLKPGIYRLNSMSRKGKIHHIATLYVPMRSNKQAQLF